MKEISFPSEPVRADMAAGGYPGKGAGHLHPYDPQAQHMELGKALS